MRRRRHDGAVLFLHDGTGSPPKGATAVRIGDPVPVRAWESVTVALADVAVLRRAVSGLPNCGTSADITIELTGEPADSCLAAGRLGDGPALLSLSSTPGTLSTSYAEPVPVRRLLIDVARRAGRTPLTAGWPVIGMAPDAPVQEWPVADPDLRVPFDEGEFLPDVVLDRGLDTPPRPSAALDQRETLGQPVPDEALGRREPDEALGRAPVVVRDDGLGPFDDQVLNPIGVVLREPVPIDWAGDRRAVARAVVERALQGATQTTGAVPEWAVTLLGDDLALALAESTGDVELDSIRQRRAAHLSHAQRGWRLALADEAGLPRTPTRVSVLLCTRRPGMVEFALRQIEAQRHPEIEVVLACHGFDHPGGIGIPSDVPFGEALNIAARRATGDVLLKMDDDDWYSPDFVTDLLIARDYSGADVTGTAPAWWYLEGSDRTVQHDWPAERHADFVAGGTLLMSRDLFADIGGFRPVRRAVDHALLLAARSAGGTIYRTHGRGYLLRRTTGHTWAVGDQELVDDPRTTRVLAGRHVPWEPIDPSAG